MTIASLAVRQAKRTWAALSSAEPPQSLGDFNTPPRVVIISAIAVVLGVLGAFVALALLRLIELCTNIFFFGEFSTDVPPIADNDLGVAIILVPVIGGLIVGLMARFGSDRIRGHGIPEAIEAILMNGSRVDPKVAVLKPTSSAIAIGSGGPFGAEGPIILTGGAFGSIAAQLLRLSSLERRTLLVAGAAAGMSATFGAPVAAVMLAAELLLFELKPRSLIPVALASATAGIVRHYILAPAPLFPVPVHSDFIGLGGLGACVLIGISAGAGSAVLTAAVYGCEDAFHRLPIHWMWWPALGGIAVGAGGLIFPDALGVGYPTIERLLEGDAPVRIALGVLLVKSTIWAVALGSGTSGGVLAPLLMMGAAIGALEGNFLPDEGLGFWPLIAMGAMIGGTMRSPLTGIVFALELTRDMDAALPLLVAVMVAHGFTVLTLRRSILTEKLSRRGFHLGREYSVDPLENAVVRQVMTTDVISLPGDLTPAAIAQTPALAPGGGHALYPIIDEAGRLTGAIARADLAALVESSRDGGFDRPFREIPGGNIVTANPEESLRAVATRMASTGRTRMPVIERATGRLVGIVSVEDLLSARLFAHEEEERRERVLQIRRRAHVRQWPAH